MIEENDQDASELEETLLLDLKNIDMVKYNIRNYFNTHEKVSKLSRGYMQIVEVLKALSWDTKVLIMDEPTASLTREEEDTLYQIIMGIDTPG